MPVVSVHRISNQAVVGGTIVVDGELVIEGPWTLVLDPAVYKVRGTYTVYRYGSISPTSAGYAVTIDKSLLTAPPLVAALTGATVTYSFGATEMTVTIS